ncbi:MAG: flippase-like domain-containing protein [Bacteroidetes bacterium]|nr:flippase-like domain-containing protein [Bacteroidota bacterium]
MKLKILNYRTLFFLIGFGMLAYLVYKLGFQTIINNIFKTGWWFLGVIGIWLIIYILNALAWFNIIGEEKKEIGFGKVLKFTISGFAINYITPFVSLGGEPYKVLELNKHLNKNHSTATVISYNMMHIFSHFFFWLTAIIALFLTIEIEIRSMLLLILGMIICISVIYLFFKAYKRGIVELAIKTFSKIYFARLFVKKIKDKQELLQNVDKYIIDLYHDRRNSFYYILSLEYFARIIGCLEFFFILKAISFDISLFDAFLISAGSSLFANLFFFIPLQMGSRESGFYLVFQSLKLTPAIGVYVSIITRIREFFWILIGLILINIKPKTNIINVEYE